MYVLGLTTLLLIPALVLSKGYMCPNEPEGATTCDILPKHCGTKGDVVCHTPGERCCPHGCHGPTCLPVVARMCPVGEPLNNTNGTPRRCTKDGLKCPASHDCYRNKYNPHGVCCKKPILPDCRGMVCGADMMCYMKPVEGCPAAGPCDPLPTCIIHPCKNMRCPRGQTCRLQKGNKQPVGKCEVVKV